MNKDQIDEVRSALENIMQGCITLNKVLTAIQIPEPGKNSDAGVRDAHVQAYHEHLGLHCSPEKDRTRKAVLNGINRALARSPESQFLQQAIRDYEKSLQPRKEGDLPDDLASLWHMRDWG